MIEIKTDRLFFRRFELKDLDFLIELMTDIEVMKHTGFQRAMSPHDIRQKLEEWRKNEGSFGVWAVIEVTTSKTLGWSMLKTSESIPELGYMFPQKHWNKGYATEVTKALLSYGHQHLGLLDIQANTNANNLASIHVLKKSGMILQGQKQNIQSYISSIDVK